MASRDAKIRTLSLISATLAFAAGGGAATCAFAGPFSFAPMNPASPIAAQAHEAQQHPGPYPTFAQVPPLPKDVRPVSAWRADIADTWALKRQTEAEAAAIPFTLAQGDAQPWADAELAKIPAPEMVPPSADSSQETEAFAAAARARATPPPPHN